MQMRIEKFLGSYLVRMKVYVHFMDYFNEYSDRMT